MLTDELLDLPIIGAYTRSSDHEWIYRLDCRGGYLTRLTGVATARPMMFYYVSLEDLVRGHGGDRGEIEAALSVKPTRDILERSTSIA